MFRQIENLRKSGTAVIYISRHLDEILSLADRVTILKDGKIKGLLNIRDTNLDQIIGMMIGKDYKETVKSESFAKEDSVLSIKDLMTTDGKVNGISYVLRKGEILGFYGVIGAGRTEMAKAVFIGHNRRQGEIRVNGEPVHIDSAQKAIRHGIVYSPQDRKSEGLLMNMGVSRNITVTILKKICRLGLIKKKEADRIVENYIKSLKIKTPSAFREVKYLSGGNQQKVVISKWLATESEVLIFDEPTIGIDVGTKEEILNIVLSLSQTGKSIIIISSEVEELMKVCDRILIMRQGLLVKEFDRLEFDKHKLIAAAVGGEV